LEFVVVGRFKFVVFGLVVGGLVAVALSALVPAVSEESSTLPTLAVAPRFSLKSDSGELIESENLKGKPYLMMFFFTSCQGICPAINGNVKRLLSELPQESSVTIVAVSVDPERDTVEALKNYRIKMALPESWKLISVDEAEVERLMTELKLVSGEDPSLHSTRVVFVDGGGHVKKFAEGREVDSLLELKGLL
jgi:protein SCO1/2